MATVHSPKLQAPAEVLLSSNGSLNHDITPLERALCILNSFTPHREDSTISRLWCNLQTEFQRATSNPDEAIVLSSLSPSSLTNLDKARKTSPALSSLPSLPIPEKPVSFASWAFKKVDHKIICLATKNEFSDHLRVENGKGKDKGSKGSGGRGTRLNAVAHSFGVTPSLFCFLFGKEVFPGCRPALQALRNLKLSQPECNINTLFAAYENTSAHETNPGITKADNVLRKRFKDAITSLDPEAWPTSTVKEASRKEPTRSMPAIPTLPASTYHLPSNRESEDDVPEEDEIEEAPVVTACAQSQNNSALAGEQSRALRGATHDHSGDDTNHSANSLDTAYFLTDGGEQYGTRQRDDNGLSFSPSAESESEEEPEQQRNNPHTRLSIIGDTQASFQQPLSQSLEHIPSSPGESVFFELSPTPLDESPVCGSAPSTPTQYDASFPFRFHRSDKHNPLDGKLCRKRPAAHQEDHETMSKQMRLSKAKPEKPGWHLETFGSPISGKGTSSGLNEPTKLFPQATKRSTRPCLEMLSTAGDSLEQEQWLNDVAVNTLLSRLSGPETAVLDCLTVESQLTARRSSMLRERLEGKEVVLIPVHENANHWVLYTFDLKNENLTRYDSLRSLSNSAMTHNSSTQKVSRLCPQQEQGNTWDCGIYVVWFARKIANRVSVNGAVGVNRIGLRHELYTSAAASISADALHEDWLPLVNRPSCFALAKWILEHRARNNDLEKLRRPTYFQHGDVWRMLQKDAHHTVQGALAAIVSRLHASHEIHLHAAAEAERLQREGMKKEEEELASYCKAVNLIPLLRIPSALYNTQGEKQILASFASMAEAINAFVKEKQLVPSSSDDLWDSHQDHHRNHTISRLYRLCVVHILVLRYAVAKFSPTGQGEALIL
ncbi:ulp1 protease family protein [Colletotrichum incanum]|uniref:Ulp1 protease family protein n=1 Tax=Colletotrichum incanum TaxID=1573173 RepID=A0A161X3J9_COLIC|nr:ulp1 protease family protein [Colletotrichum incanum]